MHAWHPALDAGDMQETMRQVYLLPPERAQFGRPEAMPVGQQDHGRVPMAMAVIPGSLHKPFDLTLRQVFTLAVMGVGQTTSANCSLYRGWWPGLMGRVHGITRLFPWPYVLISAMITLDVSKLWMNE